MPNDTTPRTAPATIDTTPPDVFLPATLRATVQLAPVLEPIKVPRTHPGDLRDAVREVLFRDVEKTHTANALVSELRTSVYQDVTAKTDALTDLILRLDRLLSKWDKHVVDSYNENVPYAEWKNRISLWDKRFTAAMESHPEYVEAQELRRRAASIRSDAFHAIEGQVKPSRIRTALKALERAEEARVATSYSGAHDWQADGDAARAERRRRSEERKSERARGEEAVSAIAARLAEAGIEGVSTVDGYDDPRDRLTLNRKQTIALASLLETLS